MRSRPERDADRRGTVTNAAPLMLGGLIERQLGRPSAPDSFDRALTVNTIYFWPRPKHALGELRRVLKPGAQLVVATERRRIPKSIARHGLRVYTEAEQVDLQQEAGFGDVTPVQRGAFVFVLAEKV